MVDDKHSELNGIIQTLAENSLTSDEAKIKEIADKLNCIYSDNFRHLYSSISGKLYSISQGNGSAFYNISGNLELIKSVIEKSEDYSEHSKRCFYKLFDHIMLEYSHWENVSGKIDGMETKTNNIENQLNVAASQLDTTANKLNDAENKLKILDETTDKYKLDMIAVLGIFSAISIAFTGGLGFSGSILQSMAQVNIDKLILISGILALLLSNVFWVMLIFILKVLRREIKHLVLVAVIFDIIILLMIFLAIFGVFSCINPMLNFS